MRKVKQTSQTWLAVLAALGLAAVSVQAQTVVTCPTIPTSIWSPLGSPYIIPCDTTLPSGSTLTILPGTVVWIGQGMSLTCNGQITAVGTPDQRITFQSPNSTQVWNKIQVNNASGTNQFNYCDFSNASNEIVFVGGNNEVRHCNFSNANTALDFGGASANQVMYCAFSNANTALFFRGNSVNAAKYCNFQSVTNGIYMTVSSWNYTEGNQLTTVLNCSFSNCFDKAIYGESIASGNQRSSWIRATIRNSYFKMVGTGCTFYCSGKSDPWVPSRGYGDLKLFNNILENINNTAVLLTAGSFPGGGQATLINNTLVNAGQGIVAQDPWDATVQSCVFKGCSNAVTRSGSLSAAVSYNGFFGNATNFTGYPSTYGQVIIANRNGTPSDLLFNIFQDPLFVGSNDYHLSTNSPCIDAGTPDWAFTDMCFTNGTSQGNSFPDQGAYGGPDACNWLDDVPVLLAEPRSISVSNNFVWLGWGAVPRSSYQILYSLTSPGSPTGPASNEWQTLPNGLVLATDKPTSFPVWSYPTTNNHAFFSIQSLGRTPGN